MAPLITLAIDESNWDGENSPAFIDALRTAGVGLVGVRASLEHAAGALGRPHGAAQQARLERAGVYDLRPIARQQMQSLHAAGIPFFIYPWFYLSWDPVQTMKDTAALCDGLPFAFSAIDMEELTDVGSPAQNVAWLSAALAQGDAQNWQQAVYTGPWWWVPKMGDSTAFAGRWLWVADYDNTPDLSVFARFGGWTKLAGKQYAGSGAGLSVGGKAVDWSVFDPAVLAAPTPVPVPVPEPQPVPTPAPEPAPVVQANQIRYLLQSLDKNLDHQAPIEDVKADILALEHSLEGTTA